jgi:hypothetical protein
VTPDDFPTGQYANLAYAFDRRLDQDGLDFHNEKPPIRLYIILYFIDLDCNSVWAVL